MSRKLIILAGSVGMVLGAVAVHGVANAGVIRTDSGETLYVSGPADGLYRSPSGNLVCSYGNQLGILCVSRSTQRWAALQSWTGRTWTGRGQLGQMYVNGKAPRVVTIPYGRTQKVGGSFRIRSATDGFTVRSTITGAGFWIAREGVYAW